MSTYKRHRFPPDIISYAVWLYYRFNLSHRDVEDLLAERGIQVSRESIRRWCINFGALYAKRLKRRHRGYGDTFFIDEVFVKINGIQHYLWRAVDQDGEVVDVYLQAKRDGVAAQRCFKRLLKSHGEEPRTIVTDKLRSYNVAHRELVPDTFHLTRQYANNRAEQSHEATRVRERGMRRFKSIIQAQRFLGTHAAVSNLFNLGRHLVRAQHYRDLRTSAFRDWGRVVA
ncbi:MAG: IS6 family transposase [Pseudomonadales bacterium]